MNPNSPPTFLNTTMRLRLWYTFMLLIFAVLIVRLFYLQVIKHDQYKKAAILTQLREYEIPAERGTIMAYDGEQVVPLVLNEAKYTVFADPKYVKNAKSESALVAAVIGGDASKIETLMKSNSRYVVLAKKLTKDQKEKAENLKLKSIGSRVEPNRTYPEGSLAAQVLGFVDDEGNGKYGIEQYLDSDLKGKPGQLKAITDAAGVPLASNKDNILIQPSRGKETVLTLDINMQRQLEDILKAGLDRAVSKSGSALIMDPYTGAIKAMANYPTYNPAEFFKVDDASLFTNPAVSSPLEVGSSMKPFTAAAALDQGVVTTATSYNDPSRVKIDGAVITNIEEDGGPGVRSLQDILQLSLNTGAVYLLQQMGGGQVNEQARTRWHDYLVNHYRFGQLTGIEQGYEAGGDVIAPTNGYGLNIQYANMAFGQGMQQTPLQMGAALSAVINGGTFYRPRLVDGSVDEAGKTTPKKPEILNSRVVSPTVSTTMQSLMEYIVSKNIYPAFRPGYGIGGKTGTAQIAKPGGGGYYENDYNGMYIGFVGGDKPQYVIIIRVNNPKIGGYAGSQAAQPIFTSVVNMLINNFNITPKSP